MPTKRKIAQNLKDRVEQIDKLRKTIDDDLDLRFTTPLTQTHFKLLGWINDEANYQTEIISLLRPFCKDELSRNMLDKLSEEVKNIADASNESTRDWETSYESDPTQFFREFFRVMENGIGFFGRLQNTRGRLKLTCDDLVSVFLNRG